MSVFLEIYIRSPKHMHRKQDRLLSELDRNADRLISFYEFAAEIVKDPAIARHLLLLDRLKQQVARGKKVLSKSKSKVLDRRTWRTVKKLHRDLQKELATIRGKCPKKTTQKVGEDEGFRYVRSWPIARSFGITPY